MLLLSVLIVNLNVVILVYLVPKYCQFENATFFTSLNKNPFKTNKNPYLTNNCYLI